jgi:hypothetical protein
MEKLFIKKHNNLYQDIKQALVFEFPKLVSSFFIFSKMAEVSEAIDYLKILFS